MTDEQLLVANKYLAEYTQDVLKFSTPNMRFVKVSLGKYVFVLESMSLSLE
jgi:hypothetical protein